MGTQTLKVALTMPTTTGDTVVIVRQLTGAPLSLTLSPSSTVAQLKKMVERKNSVAADSQRIVFSGRELENARALSYYGMAAGAEHQATLVLKTKGMRVLVKTLKECTFTIDCDATSTVLEMKHKVAEQDAQWHVQRQRIILQRKQAHVEQLEYQLSCSRSENEFLKKRVATLEAQVASLSLQPVCKPDTFRHRDPVACEA